MYVFMKGKKLNVTLVMWYVTHDGRRQSTWLSTEWDCRLSDSNSHAAVKIGSFVHLTLPAYLGRDTRSHGSPLSGIYASENKRSHTRDKCVTCRGPT